MNYALFYSCMMAGLVTGIEASLCSGLDPVGAVAVVCLGAVTGAASGIAAAGAQVLSSLAGSGTTVHRVCLAACFAFASIPALFDLRSSATLSVFGSTVGWMLLVPAAAGASFAAALHAYRTLSLQGRRGFYAAVGMIIPGAVFVPACCALPAARELHDLLTLSAALWAILFMATGFYSLGRKMRSGTAKKKKTFLQAAASVCISVLILFFMPLDADSEFRLAGSGIWGRGVLGLRSIFKEQAEGSRVVSERETGKGENGSESSYHHLLRKGASVVLVTVDALRADHMGIYGYSRPTTPFVDRWASDAFVFEHAYAVSSRSSFSIPAVFAGRSIAADMLSGARLPPFLADVLSAQNYETIAVYPDKIFSTSREENEPVRKRRLGFDTRSEALREADALRKQTLELIGSIKKRPVFLWVHFYDPHLPYTLHPDHYFGEADVDRYDSEIAHFDAVFERFVAEIEKLLPGAVWALTADHGEAFGEHGRLYHSTDLHNEQIRVPLVVRIPGERGGRVDVGVSTARIGPTLAAMVTAGSEKALSGDSLVPCMAGHCAPVPVFASVRQYRMVIDGGIKAICYGTYGPCALYDLNADPGEVHNLADKRKRTLKRLKAYLAQHERRSIEILNASKPWALVSGRLGDTASIPQLEKLALSDGDAYALEAAQVLAMFRGRDNAQALLNIFNNTHSSETRAWAAAGLLRSGRAYPDAAREALVPFLAHSNAPLAKQAPIVKQAAYALGRAKDTRALPHLLKILENGTKEEKAEAAVALGMLGDPAALEPLINLMPVKMCRWAVIDAVGMLGDSSSARVLSRYMKDDPDRTNLLRYLRAMVRLRAVGTDAAPGLEGPGSVTVRNVKGTLWLVADRADGVKVPVEISVSVDGSHAGIAALDGNPVNHLVELSAIRAARTRITLEADDAESMGAWMVINERARRESNPQPSVP